MVASTGGQRVAATPRGEARERILDTAFRLFYAHGVRGVGVDTIIASSGVAKATFYRHFPSKDDLAVAYARATYDEERWVEMAIVRKEHVIELWQPGEA